MIPFHLTPTYKSQKFDVSNGIIMKQEYDAVQSNHVKVL